MCIILQALKVYQSLIFFIPVFIYVHSPRPLLETWLLFDYLLLFEEIQYTVLTLQIVSLDLSPLCLPLSPLCTPGRRG